MDSVDWGTVTAVGALVAASFGYLARQTQRLEDNLLGRMDRMDSRIDRFDGRIDRMEAAIRSDIAQLTERYIAHLERHPH